MENLVQTQTTQKKVYEPLPEDTYKVRLVSFEILPTRAGDGKRGNATFEVLGGDFGSKDGKKGRKLFHNFNIENKSARSVDISNQQLNQLFAAAGSSSTIEDLGFDYGAVMEEAGEIPVLAKVAGAEYTNKDGDIVKTNRITSFKAR